MPIDKRELEQIMEESGQHTGPTDTPDPDLVITPFCISCGYNLAGAVSPRCPECGEVFVAKIWREKAAQAAEVLNHIRSANRCVNRGFIAAVIGVIAQLIYVTIPNGAAAIPIAMTALVAGISAFFLGLTVFRCPVSPMHVSASSVRPNRLMGAACAMAGAVITAACIAT